MVELPPIPVVCAGTQLWMERWRSESCKRMLRTRKILTSFKYGPEISDKTKEEFEKKQKSRRASDFSAKLERVVGEAHEKILKCSKEKVKVGKFCAQVEEVLAGLDQSLEANKKIMARRRLRPVKEMKGEDCPDVLLREEKKALKQSREILVLQLKIAKEAGKMLNVVQDSMERFVHVVLKYLDVFGIRHVANQTAEKVKDLYCDLPGQQYPLTEKDVEVLIKKFCALSTTLEEAINEVGSKVTEAKENVNDIIEKREKLRNVVDKNVAGKLTETTHIKKQLEETWTSSLQYQHYHDRKYSEACMTLRYAPDCKHVRDYAENTGKLLSKLARIRTSIGDDVLRKKKSIHLDNTIMKRRKRDMKHFQALKY